MSADDRRGSIGDVMTWSSALEAAVDGDAEAVLVKAQPTAQIADIQGVLGVRAL